MISLTPPQLALLRFIAGYQAAHGGISPTLQECARALGYPMRSGVHPLLCRLEERGAICRVREHKRAIEVLVPVAIPSVGGTPLYAVPMVEQARQAFSGERV